MAARDADIASKEDQLKTVGQQLVRRCTPPGGTRGWIYDEDKTLELPPTSDRASAIIARYKLATCGDEPIDLEAKKYNSPSLNTLKLHLTNAALCDANGRNGIAEGRDYVRHAGDAFRFARLAGAEVPPQASRRCEWRQRTCSPTIDVRKPAHARQT